MNKEMSEEDKQTVDHGGVLFPTAFDDSQARFPIYSPWSNLHHKPIKGRAPWSALMRADIKHRF